jgi:hypothetical protein
MGVSTTAVKQLSVTQWIFWVAAVLSMLAVGFFSYRTERRAHCQEEYNNVMNERTRVLAEATEQERLTERRADDAQAAVFTDPALDRPSEQRTPEEKERIANLFREYQAALRLQVQERAEADAARARHPVPPPPSKLCG